MRSTFFRRNKTSNACETVGRATPVGQSGVILGFGGQVVTYPGLNWPVTLVLAPSVSYRFP